ncbi:glycosyltransferase family 2 protein [Methanobacterium ferruginis]|uniref:glycosyltransferase family 2 protein n=1 Tax=Methanobacterium ferruginis TaxID=710191 RepID=UPI00257457FA|nr:glycosyltransferase [Methanobacterium ferruginis]
MSGHNKPLVSVIIPTYNRADSIGESIISLLNQTYTNFEIIIVDDGSTDKTEGVIKKFKDNRIKYVKHEKNKGVAHALNTGIKESNGVFISFLGSDDEWLPQKLDKELKVFQHSNSKLGVVYSGLWQLRGDKKTYMPSATFRKKEDNIHEELLNGNFVNGLSLVKKECFENVGVFDEKLPCLVDWELYIRISKYYHFKFVDEPLIVAPISDDSISVNAAKLVNAHKLILEKHKKDFIDHKRALAKTYGYIGSWLCLDGKSKNARTYFIKAINMDPFYINSYFAILSSFFGRGIYEKFFEIHVNIRGLFSKRK